MIKAQQRCMIMNLNKINARYLYSQDCCWISILRLILVMYFRFWFYRWLSRLDVCKKVYVICKVQKKRFMHTANNILPRFFTMFQEFDDHSKKGLYKKFAKKGSFSTKLCANRVKWLDCIFLVSFSLMTQRRTKLTIKLN